MVLLRDVSVSGVRRNMVMQMNARRRFILSERGGVFARHPHLADGEGSFPSVVPPKTDQSDRFARIGRASDRAERFLGAAALRSLREEYVSSCVRAAISGACWILTLKDLSWPSGGLSM